MSRKKRGRTPCDRGREAQDFDRLRRGVVNNLPAMQCDEQPRCGETGAAAVSVRARLIERGVRIRCPETVDFEEDIRPEQIAPGVVLHAGTRLRGPSTSIGPNCVIGAEGPVTIVDCRLGCGVELKGGFFEGAVFLDGASMGSAAHVRPGTLLEEEASAAHAVGFKQTILFPFVTAGSLINFCDALMSGGTSRRNHSEIGSSFVHFNFTPHQDKATASLIGDVPRGVMLDQPPIFLGGQGGLVGPARIGFGAIIPAGQVVRGGVPPQYGAPHPTGARAVASGTFRQGLYRSLRRVLANNISYIGNLRALRVWYRAARQRFMSGDPYAAACHAGALRQLDAAIAERRKRLLEVIARLPQSLELARAVPEASLPPGLIGLHREWIERGTERIARAVEIEIESAGGAARDRFLSEWDRADAGGGYLAAVRNLSPEARRAGTAWLQGVVDRCAAAAEIMNAEA